MLNINKIKIYCHEDECLRKYNVKGLTDLIPGIHIHIQNIIFYSHKKVTG